MESWNKARQQAVAYSCTWTCDRLLILFVQRLVRFDCWVLGNATPLEQRHSYGHVCYMWEYMFMCVIYVWMCVCMGGYWCILALVLYVATSVLTPSLGMDMCTNNLSFPNKVWIYISMSVDSQSLHCYCSVLSLCMKLSVSQPVWSMSWIILTLFQLGFLYLIHPDITDVVDWALKKQLVLSSAICGFEFGSFLPSMAERNQTFYAVKLHRLLCCPNISSPIQVTITTLAPEWRYMFWFTHQF